MRNQIVIALTALACTVIPATLNAQNNGFNSSRANVGGNKGSAFNANRANNFNDYRQKLNAQYVSKMRENWQSYNSVKPLEAPDKDVKPVVPIKMSDEDAKKEKQDKKIVIKSVVKPIKQVTPPQPVAPIDEVPQTTQQYISFNYLGTQMKVRKPEAPAPTIAKMNENGIADAWEQLCQETYNNLVIDCMKLRSTHRLCDWAYLKMLESLGKSYCGAGNEATLVTAFIYSQSGYKIRLGIAKGQLALFYTSQHTIYGESYINEGNDKFYTLSADPIEVRMTSARYPNEQPLSLWVQSDPQVNYAASPQRTLTSRRYPDMSVRVSVNKNLLPFFNTYPTSEVGGNFMTRWAMYANTALCKETQNELYPQLKRAINGRSQLEAAERLLNWVQTAFVYEYDDKVWGDDRAFFPDETLYYPYCDCEDRSILFTRLVRDLLGLKCILIYYPGHLACAVNFTENVNGDHIMVNGAKYIVCDPTFIGASVGHTMTGYDNKTANVILLQ